MKRVFERPFVGYTLLLAVLAILSAVPYLAGLNHAFVYDDIGQLVENVYLRNPAHIWDVLTLKTLAEPGVINGRRPVVLLCYFTDRALWGLRPAGWRVTNLLFHIGSVWALFLLALRIARREQANAAVPFAMTAAALFGMHPVLLEAVHAPSFRPDVLYSFFGLAYLLCSTGLWSENGRHRGLSLAGMVITLLLSLLSKESAVVLPFLLAGMWILLPAQRPSKQAMAAAFGLSVMAVGAVLMAYLPVGSLQAVGRTWNGLSLRYPANLQTLPWLWLLSIRVMVLPYPLVVDRIITPVTTFTDLRFILGVAALAGSAVYVLFPRRHARSSFGVLWVAACFAPVSNLVPLLNPFAERYLYFGAAGFAWVLACWLVRDGFGRGPAQSLRRAVLGVLCAGYLVLGFGRMPDWRDAPTLWRKTLQQEPESARAHVWMGLYMKQQDRYPLAARHFAMADRLNPQNVTAPINQGILYGQLGDLEESERRLRMAVARRPDKASAHWNLAVTLQVMGRSDEALEEMEAALACNPRHMEALRGIIVLLSARERYEDALPYARRMLELDPGNPDAQAAIHYLEVRSRQ
jgi:Flp pilus assembly protein TadD